MRRLQLPTPNVESDCAPRAGRYGEGPIMPNFMRAEEPPAPTEAPAPPSTPGAIEVGGQVYVAAG